MLEAQESSCFFAEWCSARNKPSLQCSLGVRCGPPRYQSKGGQREEERRRHACPVKDEREMS